MSDDRPFWLPMPVAAATVFLQLAILGRAYGDIDEEQWELIRPVCTAWARHAPHPGPMRRPDVTGTWGPIPEELVRRVMAAELPEWCATCSRWVIPRETR